MSRKDGKATETEMNVLHGKLATKLKDLIDAEHFDVKTDKKIHIPAAYLNVARQFLKDMGIEVDVEKYRDNEKFLQPEDLEGLDDDPNHPLH